MNDSSVGASRPPEGVAEQSTTVNASAVPTEKAAVAGSEPAAETVVSAKPATVENAEETGPVVATQDVDKDLKKADEEAPAAPSSSEPAAAPSSEQAVAQETAPVAAAKAEDADMKADGTQAGQSTEPQKSQAPAPSASLSQLLWTTGAASGQANINAAQHDEDMEPLDRSSSLEDSIHSEFSIDEDTKAKCAEAQGKDGNGLFSLELTTYQCSVLNSKLSALKLRFEPTEAVIQQMKRREKERRLIEKEKEKELARQMKLMEKKKKKMFNTDVLLDQQDTHDIAPRSVGSVSQQAAVAAEEPTTQQMAAERSSPEHKNESIAASGAPASDRAVSESAKEDAHMANASGNVLDDASQARPAGDLDADKKQGS